MNELDELMNRRITRKQFPVAIGMGLASIMGLLRLARGASDEKPAPVEESVREPVEAQPPSGPIYGAWRPRTAGGGTKPMV